MPNLCSRKPVGIDAQGKTRLLFELGGAAGEQFQLRFALDVDLEDSRLQRQIELRLCLAHAGKNDSSGGFRRGGQHSLQFATGDNVKARTMVREQLQNGQRRVDFDRVADHVLAARECLLKKPQPLDDLVGGIDVERRAVALGERCKRNLAAMQGAALLRVMKRAGR